MLKYWTKRKVGTLHDVEAEHAVQAATFATEERASR
jgi:hypothetical protein